MQNDFKPEIERKYLIKSIPFDLSEFQFEEILQGYISEPEDDLTVRVRKKGEKYFKTLKKKGLTSRLENEIEIDKNLFNELWSKTKNRRLRKTRYIIPYNDLTIELDIFKDNLDGLIIAEVEFKSLEQSSQFIPPEWFGEDVTSSPKFSNAYLAKYGYKAD